jgi:NAD(P)-dependent dehydrogenase (short-subunit alcohol dehydrogenase family)
MDYRDRHVVVTGGTGALGTATVGALVGAGAVCHVPYIDRAEAARFALRDHPQVKLVADAELSEEAAVARLYRGVPTLWASIHIAGGFAMAPLADTTRADLMKQLDMNLVTAFLCCRAAVRAMTAGGGGGGHGAHGGARRGGGEGGRAGQRDRAVDLGHPGEPAGDAQGQPCRLGEARGRGGDHPVPGLAGELRHPRRGGAGLRADVITICGRSMRRKRAIWGIPG